MSRRAFLRGFRPAKAQAGQERDDTSTTSCPPAGRPHSGNTQGLTLPPVAQATLDDTTLAQLFSDIEQCAQVIAVIPRYAARQHVSGRQITLGDAHAKLLAGTVRGVQIRYRYDGSEWWDTLIATNHTARIVRVRHELD